MSMKNCPKCGTEVHFDDDICHACGTNVPIVVPWPAYLIGGFLVVVLVFWAVDWTYWADYFSRL